MLNRISNFFFVIGLRLSITFIMLFVSYTTCFPIPENGEKIEVLNLNLGKRIEGINTLKLTLKNNSNVLEAIVMDIRSSHGKYYPGWQRQFRYSLNPGEVKDISEHYEVADINSNSFLRVRLYNPLEDEDWNSTNMFFEKEYPYEGAKEYLEPLINLFDSEHVSLWVDGPNPYIGRKINEGKISIDTVDLGEVRWGVNKYRLTVRNLTANHLELKLHCWSSYETAQGAISLLKDFVLEPNEKKTLEGWYMLSLDHGRLEIVFAVIENEDSVLARRSFEYFTPVPNAGTGDLMTVFRKTYPSFNYAEGKHLVVYFIPGSKAEGDIDTFLSTREEILLRIMKMFDVKLEEKVIIFLYPSSFSKLYLTFHAGDGLAYENTIAEVYIDGPSLDPYHELTHVVAQKLGNPPALLSEGVAVFMQEGQRWNQRHVDAICAEYLAKGSLIPLGELIEYTEIGSAKSKHAISYPQAGSFVKYLIQNLGMEKFKTLYKRMKSSKDPKQLNINKEIFEEVCGKSLDSFEQAWLNYLQQFKK